MKKVFLSLTVLVLLAVSCKKEDKDESLAITKENVAGSYKLTAATMGGQDVLGFYYSEACQRDDIFTFKTDLTYAYSDAGTKCDPDGSYTDGEWSLPSSTTFDWDGETFTVSKLTKQTLQLSQGSGSSAVLVTFSRQ